MISANVWFEVTSTQSRQHNKKNKNIFTGNIDTLEHCVNLIPWTRQLKRPK